MKSQRNLVGMLGVALLVALVVGPASAWRAPGPDGLARLNPDEAIAVAVNDLTSTANGYRLRHPQHTATFAPDGWEFRPRDDSPTWAWQLTSMTAGVNPLAGVETDAVRPASDHSLAVVYRRGGVEEQYLARKDSIEQQFLIPQPLPLAGADLVIAGVVRSAGDFEETEDGWYWRIADSGVRLGNVLVYDARGAVLSATMTVTANTTRIVVAGAALAQAAYPVTVDPEIGYDRRLSIMGPYEDPDYDALNPAVAYNSLNNQYLVVWSGTEDVIGEYEIWGQRVDASNGTLYGANFQISFMGPPDDPDYDAEDPDVAYNSQDNLYLVVWSGERFADGEFEIWGQRVGSAGNLSGAIVRVSVMGPDLDPDYDALNPAVVYNSVDNQYLVVWAGDHTAGTLVDNEYEIWARRLSGIGEVIDADNRRMSDMGGSGDEYYDARTPDAAHNSSNNQYLIVWSGDDTATGMANNEFEIFGQRLNASLGGVGPNDFRISAMGPSGDPDYDAYDPAIAYNAQDDQYLVVWEGTDMGVGVWQIYGRGLGSDGSLLGTDRFLLSHAGVGPNGLYDAYNPAVAYDQRNNEYLVVWEDDEMGVGEFEVWGQRVAGANGASIGIDTRLSVMGPEGAANHDAQTPAVAYSSESNNQYLVVWSGDDSTDGEFEIWGQRFTGGFKIHLPVVTKDLN